MRWLIVMLMALSSQTVFARQDKIIVKWTPYKNNTESHEFYLDGDAALYIIKNEPLKKNREDEFPLWFVRDLTPEESKSLATALHKLASFRHQETRMYQLGSGRRCDGFHWVIDINFGEMDIVYRGLCEPYETYEKVQGLISSLMRPIDEKQR